MTRRRGALALALVAVLAAGLAFVVIRDSRSDSVERDRAGVSR